MKEIPFYIESFHICTLNYSIGKFAKGKNNDL